MRLLSPILDRMFYPAMGSVGYFHARSSPSPVVNVITYHGVLPSGYERRYPPLDNTLVNPAAFRSQLQMLKKHYNVISPEHFLAWLRRQEGLPDRAILLTCDDGLLNHLTGMLPILQEERLKCLFFVTGESLENVPRMLWYVELYLMLMEAREQDGPLLLQGVTIPQIPGDRASREALWQELMKTLSRLDAGSRREFIEEAATKFRLPAAWRTRQLDDPWLRDRFQLLRWPELKQLADAEMTIGAHTVSHPALAEQSAELARLEIVECRKAMEKSLGHEVWAIAYPFGTPAAVGEREYKLAEEAGYECGFVNWGGSLNRALPRFALPRIHVTAEMSLGVYEAHVSGFHDALRCRFRS